MVPPHCCVSCFLFNLEKIEGKLQLLWVKGNVVKLKSSYVLKNKWQSWERKNNKEKQIRSNMEIISLGTLQGWRSYYKVPGQSILFFFFCSVFHS